MARPLVVVLAAVAAGSIAANLYQWRHPKGERKTETKTETQPATGNRQPATGNGEAQTLTGAKPRPEGAPPPIAATCEGQLVDLSERLAKAEATLEERLTWDEKFERSPPSPDAETKLSPLVAKVFDKAPDGYSFDVECRGEVCNVIVTAPEKGDFEWWESLQKDVYWKEGQGHSMQGGTPTHDPVTKAALLVTKTQVRLNGADTADGIPVLQTVVDQLGSSGAITRCAADGTHGYLSLQLWLSGEPRTISYEVGGTLASSTSGRCVLSALDSIIAGATIPPRSRTAVLYHTVEI
jgi:hypothetical protein